MFQCIVSDRRVPDVHHCQTHQSLHWTTLKRPSSLHNMIPRAFLRSTGAVRSGVRAHPRQTSRLLNSWPHERQLGPRRQSLISRYYSVTTDATQATVGDTPPTDTRMTGDDQEGDALEKQLEEKNKEVIALKVRHGISHCHRSQCPAPFSLRLWS